MIGMRILLADDHQMLREGLRSVLESRAGWSICAEADNGREAVQLARRFKPEIVVMDITMPELNGLEATRQIRRILPDTEVLILTMHESEELAREVVDAGAKGYLLKTDAARVLVSAVESLLQHKTYFTSKISGLALQKRQKRDFGSERGLTPREREIVQLLAEGKSNKEVAAALNISVKTAETHRTNVMRKLQLHSISDLVRYAIRNQIVGA